jgi:hypothetical protein
MTCKGIVFESDRLTILCKPHCDYTNPADPQEQENTVREENEWAASETLGRLVVHKWPEVPPPWVGSAAVESWQSYLMHLLKPVCRHYAVNDEVVLGKFRRHYLMSIMVSPRHKKPTRDGPEERKGR